MLKKEFLLKIKDNGSHKKGKSYLKDENILLSLNRPIIEKDIIKIPNNEFEEFIDKVLEEPKSNKILYSANSKKEIKSLQKSKSTVKILKTSKSIKKNHSIDILQQKAINEIILTAKMNINKEKKNLAENKESLTRKNEIFFKNLKDNKIHSSSCDEKEKSKNFHKVYSNLINKVKLLKYPEAKLDYNNVYSRLYHNVVLTKSLKDNMKEKADKNRKENGKKKLSLTYKISFEANIGKEFTTKLSDSQKQLIFSRNSGGPDYKIVENKELNKSLVRTHSFISFQNNNGYLHDAVLRGNIQMIKYLIEKGEDVNIQNIDGNTPLHLLCSSLLDLNLKISIYNLLLKFGADLNIRNNSGLRPYELSNEEFRRLARSSGKLK